MNREGRRLIARGGFRFQSEPIRDPSEQGDFAMSVSSMTGFARASGSSGPWRWAFEVKSVNAKGLDLRLRMPAPFDRVETEARARLAKALARGTCFGTLIGPARGRRDRSANRPRGARSDRIRGARGGRESWPRASHHGRASGVAGGGGDDRGLAMTRRPSPRLARARSRALTKRSRRSASRAGSRERRSRRCSSKD